MPKTVNLYEAKTHLSELVERASRGDEVVIAQAREPKARLVPYARPVKDRKAGAWKGRVVIAPDFDAPLPEDVLAPPRAADAEGGWLGIMAGRAEITGDVVGPVVGVSEWKSSL